MGLTVINTEGTWDTRTDKPVRVTQDGFAVSDSLPLHTDGLSGCLGLVIHDPKARRGCLAHLTQISAPKAIKYADAIWGQCLQQLGIDGKAAEFFFCNGSAAWTDYLTVKVGELTASNIFDYRHGTKPDPRVGRIMGMLYYDPRNEIVGASREWAGFASATVKQINTGGRRDSKKAHQHVISAA